MKAGLKLILALALLCPSAPALAQKSADTVRIALREPIIGVDSYFDPKEETTLSVRAVFDTLIFYDEQDGQMKPLLAKSWRRVDERTLEFDLRDDVKWQDGKPFSAADVVYTIGWLIDPDNKLRFTSNYKWVEKVEALGPYAVRITGKAPYALDLLNLAFGFHIVPEHIHSGLANKATFAARPIGTGPYRALEVNASTGILLERNETYRHGGAKAATNVKRFHLVPMPDKQTQIAQMLTGGIELIGDLTKDELEAFNGNAMVTTGISPGSVYAYLLLDARGRSGIKPVQDKRVRQAIMMAIDRPAIARSLVSTQAQPLDAICLPHQFGCDSDIKAPGFDLARARQLMSEAGYANGFDLEIVTTGRSNQMGEAVANVLRRINIRASVRPVTFVAYRSMQQQGQYAALISAWTSYGGQPDMAAHMDFFYGAPARDFAGDPRLPEITGLGEKTLDHGARKALYREALNRINDNAYVTVVSTLPAQYAHSINLTVRKNAIQGLGFSVFDIAWR